MTIQKLYLNGHEAKLSQTVLNDDVTERLLPDVTVEDDGKVLSVSDGAWVLTSVDYASVIPITHSELVALRDANSLTPGQQYRITDYECTVANDSDARAVSHPYDIVVIADTSSRLNENARACSRQNDNYYSAVAAWQLKYSLDNDVTRFSWADNESGKGVVYYLKDEFNNEAYYDFKQIQFKKYVIAESEYGNLSECVADSHVPLLDGIVLSDEVVWLYTFDVKIDGEHLDASVNSVAYPNMDSRCYDNSIGPAYRDIERNAIVLPHNTVGSNLYNDLSDVVFGSQSVYNTVNSGCCILVENECIGNVLGHSVHSIHLSTSALCNVLCNQVCHADIGYACSNNVIAGIGATLGYGCTDNIINGDRNTIDRGSDHNILAALCDENYIGPGCSHIELGAAGTRNYFASGCSEIVLGSSCSDNYFGSGCANIGFYTSASGETLQNFFVKNIIDAGCSNLRLHSTTVGGVHNVQNYHILSGVSGQSADPLLIELLRDREYCTFVGKKTDGSITITNILDLVP